MYVLKIQEEVSTLVYVRYVTHVTSLYTFELLLIPFILLMNWHIQVQISEILWFDSVNFWRHWSDFLCRTAQISVSIFGAKRLLSLTSTMLKKMLQQHLIHIAIQRHNKSRRAISFYLNTKPVHDQTNCAQGLKAASNIFTIRWPKDESFGWTKFWF